MKKKTRKKNNKYRSGLEDDIANQLSKNKIKFTYEKDQNTYKVPSISRTYIPDFKIVTKSGKEIYIEGKGIWVYDDRYKHLLLRIQRPDLDIRFVFTNSKNRIRKGSKATYADICDGKGRGLFKGVTWKYADKKIPREWLDE